MFDRALSILRPTCHVLFTPQAVVLDVGGGTRLLVRQRCISPESLSEQFGAAVADLLQMMDQAKLRGRRLHVVVSDYWARPLVLPIAGKAPNAEESETVLRSHYQRFYGDLMNGWHWCWDHQGSRLLAVALPAAGLTELSIGATKRVCVLASVKPMAVEVAGQMPGESASSWIAIVQAQSASMVRRQGDSWEDWCVISADRDMATSLPIQLMRETARRRDGCRLLTLVDLSGRSDIDQIRKNLAGDGWTVNAWSAPTTGANAAGRLWRAIAAGVTT